ncbi:MAG: hypothetical protein PHF51_00760 [Candidatus ainarchaeum sp.]|nr:hypothetical protein [Candidatus ainarchaeum sp.]
MAVTVAGKRRAAGPFAGMKPPEECSVFAAQSDFAARMAERPAYAMKEPKPALIGEYMRGNDWGSVKGALMRAAEGKEGYALARKTVQEIFARGRLDILGELVRGGETHAANFAKDKLQYIGPEALEEAASVAAKDGKASPLDVAKGFEEAGRYCGPKTAKKAFDTLVEGGFIRNAANIACYGESAVVQRYGVKKLYESRREDALAWVSSNGNDRIKGHAGRMLEQLRHEKETSLGRS